MKAVNESVVWSDQVVVGGRARGRARGRGRGDYRDYSDREYASSVSGRSEFVPSTDDEDPDYEDNRKERKPIL